jgi:hypothetical protein
MLPRSYYSASATEFVRASPAGILGNLVKHHTFAVDQKQSIAWQMEVLHLQEAAKALCDSFIFLEFAIIVWVSAPTLSSSQAATFS